MLQWLIRFPEFAEFTEFLIHLGKTSFRLIFANSVWLRWTGFGIFHISLQSSEMDFNSIWNAMLEISMLEKVFSVSLNFYYMLLMLMLFIIFRKKWPLDIHLIFFSHLNRFSKRYEPVYLSDSNELQKHLHGLRFMQPNKVCAVFVFIVLPEVTNSLPHLRPYTTSFLSMAFSLWNVFVWSNCWCLIWMIKLFFKLLEMRHG